MNGVLTIFRVAPTSCIVLIKKRREYTVSLIVLLISDSEIIKSIVLNASRIRLIFLML